MQAIGKIALGGVLVSIGLALIVGYESDSRALVLLGVVLGLAGACVGVMGLAQNHRDHTEARR